MTMLPVGIIVLLVLICLCALLGALYACIYFTRINPSAIRTRNKAAALGVGCSAAAASGRLSPTPRGVAAADHHDDHDSPAPITSQLPMTSTHVFLFRKT
jgi:hypothetical protein